MKEVTEKGYEIQVGDLITAKSAFGLSRYTVTRVTENFALSKVNDVHEIKFKRLFNPFGFSSLPKKTWSNIEYKLYSKALS